MLKINFFKQTSAVYSLYPKRSRKQVFLRKITPFMIKFRRILIIITVFLIFVLIGLLIFELAQAMSGIVVVESGQYYNHLLDVI